MALGRLDYPEASLLPYGRTKLLMEVHSGQEGMRIANMRLGACTKEPWTVALIESMAPGEVFWDVGACVGSYTMIAAARGLQVVAFEPSPANYAELCRNLAHNALLDSVIVECWQLGATDATVTVFHHEIAGYPPLVVPVGIGDQDANIWLHFSSMLAGAASHLMTGECRKQTFHKMLVPLWSASTLSQTIGLPFPHVVKLDVDGFEQQVLTGMEWLLHSADLRAILCELDVR